MNLSEYDRIVVSPRVDGRLAWHYLAAGNNEILATDGGQGYEDRAPCLTAAFRVANVEIDDAPEGRHAEGEPGTFRFEVQRRFYLLPGEPQRIGTHDGGAVWCYPIRRPHD